MVKQATPAQAPSASLDVNGSEGNGQTEENANERSVFKKSAC